MKKRSRLSLTARNGRRWPESRVFLILILSGFLLATNAGEPFRGGLQRYRRPGGATGEKGGTRLAKEVDSLNKVT